MLDTPVRLTTLLSVATVLALTALILDYFHILRRPWRPALAVAITLILWGGFLTLNAVWPTSSFYGSVFYQGSQSDKVVALTFDDGPNPPYTLELLDLLDRYQVPATFFLIGQNVASYPEVAKEIARRGYVIGSHTYSHSDLLKLTDTQVAWEMDQANTVIEQITGLRPDLLRPPHGFRDPLVLTKAAERRLTVIQWSVMAEDWKKPGVETIVNRVVDSIQNGSIVLLHDGDGTVPGGDRSQTVAATQIIIQLLRQQGYRFVTVKDLLALNPFP